MGTKTEAMKAIVAVGFDGKTAVVIKHWPESLDPSSPWGCEFEAVGSSNAEDLGMGPPEKPGLWVWDGDIFYPGPNPEGVCDSGPDWSGRWTRATDADIAECKWHLDGESDDGEG